MQPLYRNLVVLALALALLPAANPLRAQEAGTALDTEEKRMVYALGLALGVTVGLGVFLATSILLLKGDDLVGPNLVLLGGLTAIDLFLAWVILMAMGLGWGYVVGLVILGGLVGYYNYDACDYIERKLL